MWHNRLRTQLFPRSPVLGPRDRRAVLRLNAFIPFRLNRLAVGVSQHLADIYRERFGLEIPEWRVIATIGESPDCTAQYIAASTRMHKTRVSRAIVSLLRRGLLERITGVRDRREQHLRLSRAGRALYAQLVPLALARERALLARLSPAERRGFITGVARLEEALALAPPATRDPPE
ncbi:MAG: MarR family transcriptional regulator [Proteobacteria bacterium]|nr:MarR family transcriptional regulator [Pseudomonadota bacterium]